MSEEFAKIQHEYSSVAEFERVANYFLSGNSSSSTGFQAMFVLTNFYLMRRLSLRILKLADTVILDHENEGPTSCKPLISFA